MKLKAYVVIAESLSVFS